jgi:HEAT repeat protein/polyhydroxyalkanoate synthesis regulator phasin
MDRLTSLTLDEKEIEKLILNGNYEDAAEIIFKVLQAQENFSNEIIYKSLNLLNYICDKTPSISLNSVKVISSIINEPNSWIRLVSLEILYQISMYRPNLLIELIDKIRARLFDQESQIRRLAVKIMGKLLLSLHVDEEELQEYIGEFIERLIDEDWNVKILVIKTLKKLLNQDFTKIPDLEPLLSIVIVNLRDEDEDVARSSAELLKILGTYFLSKEKIMYILLNLLQNEKSRVKELIIWLFGEIGKEKSSEIIPIIPKLINFLREDDYRIQLRVIEALVNISKNNLDQIWSNLIHALDSEEDEVKNSVLNALYHLCQNNILDIFNYIFEELENPSENVRESVAKTLQRLYEEYQVEIENEITKILYNLDSKYWRERKKSIVLLRTICFILNVQKIAVWIYIELDKVLDDEKDPDVRNEIIHTLKNIKANFERIEEIIKKVNFELELFSNKIKEFQKAPAKFREDLNGYIEEFRFNETEIELNNEYRNILKQIKAFNKRLNKFEYKRLAFNLIEDWEETKLQIIDELSLIKGFISELCDEKKEEFTKSLKEKVRVFYDRISILRVQYDVLKEYDFPDNLDESVFTEPEDKELEEKFNQITQLRNYLFKLDDEIRELILNNVEFDIFKNLLRTWVGVKIEIQEYLSNLDKKIKVIKDKMVEYFIEIQNRKQNIDTKLSNITNELGFQLFQGHIHSIISQGIEGFKNFNENFENLNKKIDQLIKKTEFNDAKKIMEMNQKQIQNFIEDYENQIDTIIGKITDDNNIFDLYIRPLLTKFIESKEMLIIKSKSFKQKNLAKLYLNQINYYLEVMNPIKINNLSSYMDLEVDDLNELLVNFINKNKLNAKVIEDSLHSPKMEDLYESKDLLLFRTTKTIGNLITLDFKLSNPTSLSFRDLQITLKTPLYISFVKKESFPRFLFVNELKSGNAFKFKYLLKRNRIDERKISDPSSDQITLNIFYRDPFNITRKITKKIDLLLP